MSEAAAPPIPAPPRPAEGYHLGLCLAWTFGALTSFIVMALSVRGLTSHFNAFEILALRNLGGVALLAVLTLLRPSMREDWRLRRPGMHLLRNLLHFAGQYTWVQAILVLPLAMVFALEFTMPIFLALLAAPLLGERLTAPRLAAVGLGFLGVLAIVRPGAASIDPHIWLPLVAALFFALVAIATKLLTRTETTLSILVWMNLVQLPLNLAGSGEGFFARIPAAPLLPLAGVCLSGFVAHFCLTNAYRRGDALTVVPLDFLRLPLIAVAGYLMFAEPLDPFVFIGGAIILGGVTWNLWVEARAER